MSAARHDIVVEEESDFTLEVEWQDANCDPQDVSGYGAALQVREERKSSSTVVLEGSTSDGRISLGAATGVFSIDIPESAVNNVTSSFESGFYDLLIWPSASSPGVDPNRLMSGRARYEKAATYK